MAYKPPREAAPTEQGQTSAAWRLQQQETRAEHLDRLRQQATADQTRRYFAQSGPLSLGQTLLAVKEQRQREALPPWRPQRFPHRAKDLDRLQTHAPPHQSLRYASQPGPSNLGQTLIETSAQAISSIHSTEVESQIDTDAAIAHELALELQADTDAGLAQELAVGLQAEADAEIAREMDTDLNESPLLRLPAEIRNRIYLYAAIEAVQGQYLDMPGHSKGNGLLWLNRQVRSEYLPVLRSKQVCSAKYLKTITPAAWVELNPHRMIAYLQKLRDTIFVHRIRRESVLHMPHMYFHTERSSLPSRQQEEEIRSYAAEQMCNRHEFQYADGYLNPWYRGLLMFGENGEEGSITFEIDSGPAVLQTYRA